MSEAKELSILQGGAASYDTAQGNVSLTLADVKKTLVRGGGVVTDQEVLTFIELCRYQHLNPWLNEAYLIKYKDECSIVTGYGAYVRRAEENPKYRGRRDGITVQRGAQIVQKPGCCLYTGEKLLGGWCKVYVQRGETIDEIFREVALSEYDKGMANWKTKPCTMINKVAISQALRAAFPRDFEGLYTAEELSPTGGVPEEKPQDGETIAADMGDGEITQEDRKMLFGRAMYVYGKESGVSELRRMLGELGLESTNSLKRADMDAMMERIDADEKRMQDAAQEAQNSEDTGKTEETPEGG
ncbi:MAG TPA: phage recombination protein Bet [Candidatus Omnitrophota bacterium]|nr:phage recombination protein Bet [Candidatus Omnitrophota bacterium]